VRDLIGRLKALDPAGVKALAETARRVGLVDGPTEDPWPAGTPPGDDEVLRVSSILAAQDAAAAVPDIVEEATVARARWAASDSTLRTASSSDSRSSLPCTSWRFSSSSTSQGSSP